MSQHNVPQMPGPSVESLTQRHELFKLMQNSHLRWMHETNDPDIKEMHRALADQFQIVVSNMKYF